MKLNLKFWKYQFIERIKQIKNNRLILSILVVIFLLIVLIPFFFILFNVNSNKYQGVTQHSLQSRFQAETVSCIENITEKDSVSCRRGPVVIAATENIARKLLKYNQNSGVVEQKIKISELNSDNYESKIFRYNWGILPDLVNWFYNNVPWGVEILTFDKIILTWANAPDWLPNYKLKGAAYGKHWGKKNSGVKIFLKSLLSGVEDDINKKNPLLNKLNNLKYHLFNTYTNYKMGLYVNDESSAYYYGGGVEAKNYREKINKKVISDYLLRRFKNINNNLSDSLPNAAVYYKAEAYKYLITQLPKLQVNNINDNLSYRDLFVLANSIYKLTTTSSFAINDSDHHWIYDGIDEFGTVGNEVTWFQLNNNELLQQFKNVEIFITPNEKRKIADVTKQELDNALADPKNDNLITSEVDFNGYSSSWIQQYLLSLVIPILWTQNQVNIKNFNLNNNYETIIAQFEQSEKPLWMPQLIKPNRIAVENFQSKEQLKIGLLNQTAPLNYVNKMRSFISRDWEVMNFNKSFIENSKETSLILKDKALLNAFGANPYHQINDSKAILDMGVISSLQKVLRMDEDIAMGHLSNYSELSFIWGYMDEDDNYDYLKLTDRVGNNKLIKITTQNDLDTNYNCHHNVDCSMDDRHSIISNEFINDQEFKPTQPKITKTLLSDIVNPELGLTTARKLWITDYALLADYSNAIAAAGDYKVSFFNSNSKAEKQLVVSQKWKEYAEAKDDELHILNSNGNIIAFAGWWFYTRYGNNKELFFRIVEQSWINK